MIAKAFKPLSGSKVFAIMGTPRERGGQARRPRAGMSYPRGAGNEHAVTGWAAWPAAGRQVISRRVL